MVKHTQAIRWQLPINCLNVFDHFVGLALEGLKVKTTERHYWSNQKLLHQH